MSFKVAILVLGAVLLVGTQASKQSMEQDEHKTIAVSKGAGASGAPLQNSPINGTINNPVVGRVSRQAAAAAAAGGRFKRQAAAAAAAGGRVKRQAAAAAAAGGRS